MSDPGDVRDIVRDEIRKLIIESIVDAESSIDQMAREIVESGDASLKRWAWGVFSRAAQIVSPNNTLAVSSPSLLKDRLLEDEVRTDDILLKDREALLKAIPECPAHGYGCVPHALEWIRSARGQLLSEWSTAPPSHEGHYWAYHPEIAEVFLVWVVRDEDVLESVMLERVSRDQLPLRAFTHWIGPIIEPEFSG